MTEHVIAVFDTQFAASAAVERLIARGVSRRQIMLNYDESVHGSPASSSAPTTVVSKVAHAGSRDSIEGREPSSDRHGAALPQPQLIAKASVVVQVGGALSQVDIGRLLEQSGATQIDQTDDFPFVEDEAGLIPEGEATSVEDVTRSKIAAKAGSVLRKR